MPLLHRDRQQTHLFAVFRPGGGIGPGGFHDILHESRNRGGSALVWLVDGPDAGGLVEPELRQVIGRAAAGTRKGRSAERREGKEGVSTWSSRWAPFH